MKILITGGAGYVGTALIPLLLDHGFDVTVYDNLMYGGEYLIPFITNLNFKFIYGDVRDYNKINSILKDFDAVIHLAAIVGYAACRRQEKLAYEVNFEATKNIVENIDKDTLLLFGSTGSNYGNLEGICTEESPTKPLSIYAKSKQLGEDWVKKHYNFIAYRFATAFGISPRVRLDLLVNDFTYLANTQKYLVVYESHFMRTFIHVYDMARSFLFALNNYQKMLNNIFNVGSNSMNYSKKQICDIIEEKTKAYIHYAEFGSDVDKRDYVVSYDKINKLGYETTIKIQQGINEIINVCPLIMNPYKFKNA